MPDMTKWLYRAQICTLGLLGIVFSYPIYAFQNHIKLEEAEKLVLGTSNTLKAITAQANSANELAGAAFAPLLPLWTVSGRAQYNTHIPVFTLPGSSQSFEVGVRTPYRFGTTISYTIWDNLSNYNAYKSAKYISYSQQKAKDNTKLELLLQTRLSYLMVQLALRELKSIRDSLELVRSQFADIEAAFNAGAVAHLEWIDSKRNVLNYEIEYEKGRANVELKVKDLFALLSLPTTVEMFASEKISDTNVKLEDDLMLHFDSLEESLSRAKAWEIIRPPASQPLLQKELMLAKSFKAQADSEFAKLFPKIDVFGTSEFIYPDVIQLKTINQNTYGATVSMPIFDGINILHKVAAAKEASMMSHFNHDQIRIDLDRDYEKSLELIKNLKIQKEINEQDIKAARESAKLYYESFKNGQSLLINVQRANLQVLTSEVEGARITADMLQQLYQLQYLSGKNNI